jgi:hypothetical protein
LNCLKFAIKQPLGLDERLSGLTKAFPNGSFGIFGDGSDESADKRPGVAGDTNVEDGKTNKTGRRRSGTKALTLRNC